jgi:hypothetical protein
MRSQAAINPKFERKEKKYNSAADIWKKKSLHLERLPHFAVGRFQLRPTTPGLIRGSLETSSAQQARAPRGVYSLGSERFVRYTRIIVIHYGGADALHRWLKTSAPSRSVVK